MWNTINWLDLFVFRMDDLLFIITSTDKDNKFGASLRISTLAAIGLCLRWASFIPFHFINNVSWINCNLLKTQEHILSFTLLNKYIKSNEYQIYIYRIAIRLNWWRQTGVYAEKFSGGEGQNFGDNNFIIIFYFYLNI